MRMQQHRAVATCICGQARVLNYTMSTIDSIILARIRSQSDVFMGLSSSDENRTSGLEEMWHPRRLRFVMSQGQADTLSACFDDVRAVELKDAHTYSWVMRVRTDVLFSAAIPAYEDWPHWLEDGKSKLVFYPEWTHGQESTHPRWGRAIKDTWALMTRAAAPHYFGAWANPSSCSAQQDKYGREIGAHGVGTPELSLGCTLSLHLVRSLSIFGMKDTVVRAQSSSHNPWEITTSQIRPQHSTVMPFRFLAREICDLYGAAVVVDLAAVSSWNSTLARCDSSNEISMGRSIPPAQLDRVNLTGGHQHPTRSCTYRVFDLGGSGLKTCVLDRDTDPNEWVLSHLGHCPQSMPPHEWVRWRIPTLDAEIRAGVCIGFSRAGTVPTKLWLPELKHRTVRRNITTLLHVSGASRVVELPDGTAHLLGSLSSHPRARSQHPVVNLAIGTGVACARTDVKGERRECDFLSWRCPICNDTRPVRHLLAPHFALPAGPNSTEGEYRTFVSNWKHALTWWLTGGWPFGPERRPGVVFFTGGGVQALPIFVDSLENFRIGVTCVRLGPPIAQIRGIVAALNMLN